jgi:hypothetical protein
MQFLDFSCLLLQAFLFFGPDLFVFLLVWFRCVGEKFSNGHFLHYSVKNCHLLRLEMTVISHFAIGPSYLLCYKPPKTKIAPVNQIFLAKSPSPYTPEK